MRVQIVIRAMVVVAGSVVWAPELQAQPSAPPLPALTRGATHETRTPDLPGLTAATSRCPISDDPSYGVTPTNPIKVGGGAIYVMSRTMRFLQSLRGPSGQGLHLMRLGSFDGPEDTILDVYQVDYDGTVRHLYVDGYRSAELKAPRDLVCGAPSIDPPRPDPMAARRGLITLAAALEPAAAGPISLDSDGSAMHGVVFDHVRLIARAAAAAAAAGRPLDVTNIPSEISRPRFVVVAYPVRCEGQAPIAPQSIKVSDSEGNSPKAIKEARNEQIQALLPGFKAPASTLAVEYDADLAIPGQVEIAYGSACNGTSPIVTLAVRGEAGRITQRVAGRAPAGVALPPGGTQVRVQVCFDFAGMPHFAAFAGGPGTLADAAVAAVAEFRADPPRVNGAPLLQLSTVAVAFQP